MASLSFLLFLVIFFLLWERMKPLGLNQFQHLVLTAVAAGVVYSTLASIVIGFVQFAAQPQVQEAAAIILGIAGIGAGVYWFKLREDHNDPFSRF